jgi:hypothetical protein
MTPKDEADLRRAAFAALVEAQDGGMSVPGSRRAVAERFGVSEAEVLRVEGQWPPLG